MLGFRVAVSCTILFLVGCEDVSLSVTNNLPSASATPLNISAIINDKDGHNIGSVGLGTVNPGQTTSKQSFKVKKGGSYQVRADLGSGITVYKSGSKTVNQALPSEVVAITRLDPGMLDLTDASTIQSTFGKLGPQLGFNPVTLSSALGSLYGGLVWYVDTNDPLTPETQPVQIVPPSLLTGAVSVADFQYPAGSNMSHDDNISSSASAKVSATVPLWGNLAAGFSSNSIYKTHWSMTGFGNVSKIDSVAFQDKINALTVDEKNDICTRLKTDKSHLMYVNQMYVVKSAILTYQKGVAVTTNASMTGASVIAGDAAYDFSSSQTDQTQIGDTVVNVAGPTFTLSSFSFCSPSTTAPAKIESAAVKVIPNQSNEVIGLKDAKGSDVSLDKATITKTSLSSF